VVAKNLDYLPSLEEYPFASTNAAWDGLAIPVLQ